MRRKRRLCPYEDKAIILKRHTVIRKALSAQCEEAGCHLTKHTHWWHLFSSMPLSWCTIA